MGIMEPGRRSVLLFSQKDNEIMIHYISGNILEAKTEAVVNTINCVSKMGKGLAREFAQKYPTMFEAYKESYQLGELKIGEMFVWSPRLLKRYDGEHPRYIINFPTKEHWRNPSKLEWIEKGMEDLVDWCLMLNIKSISIPQLGCGLGGLKWEDVKPIIVEYMNLIDVETYLYEHL